MASETVYIQAQATSAQVFKASAVTCQVTAANAYKFQNIFYICINIGIRHKKTVAADGTIRKDLIHQISFHNDNWVAS